MMTLAPIEKIDYLVIGHFTKDLTSQGPRLGGTAAYSALTAASLGLRVGIVTSWEGNFLLEKLGNIPVVSYPTDICTTFENIYTAGGRIQYLRAVAPRLDFHMIPDVWRQAPIIHLGPVAQEVEPTLARRFPTALVGLTPQGWLREWDSQGRVRSCDWPEAAFTLHQAGAAVISVEDVDNDEERIEEMASNCRILAVTEAHQGAWVYWHGDVRRFRPPLTEEVDATGAGDIFATAFFFRLYNTRDPWEAGRFATQLSAYSVTRVGLDSVPRDMEIQDSLVEVLR